METAIVIVAAGRGTRAGGGDIPKQYRSLAGTSVLTRVIDGFAASLDMSSMVSVIHPDDIDCYAVAVGSRSAQLRDPVMGGATRQLSVHAGLESLSDVSPRYVLIHDAARPFADTGLISRVIAGLSEYDGVVPALAVTDTLKRASGGTIEATVDRANLWGVQTPQGFDFNKLLEAHRAAAKKSVTEFTDDSSVAEWHGLRVGLVEGSPMNIKLTTNEDFEVAEDRMRSSARSDASSLRIGQGFDVHGFDEGDHVMLCGVTIPHGKALKGHSDADVGLHALTDALLGAIGDGDIGTHFPPSDPKWRSASSDQFLKDAARRVRALNGQIVNVDVTLICETPKLGPHRELMRKSIADVLQIDVARVSVKATTTEGLGFTGRGEGIAAQASAMVQLA